MCQRANESCSTSGDSDRIFWSILDVDVSGCPSLIGTGGRGQIVEQLKRTHCFPRWSRRMNGLSGMLIEYLVIGAISSLWLFPALLKSSFFSQYANKELFGVAVAVLVPAVYLVGMLCDLIGYHATRQIKHRL